LRSAESGFEQARNDTLAVAWIATDELTTEAKRSNHQGHEVPHSNVTDACYLIPAVLLLGKRRKTMAALCRVVPPDKKGSYCYEGYREKLEFAHQEQE
jgi:hypothetical protein